MFEIVVRKKPKKYIERLDPKTKRILKAVLEQLERNPFEVIEPLHGRLKGFHKVRVGGRRMILAVHQTVRRIEVLEFGPRGDIYK